MPDFHPFPLNETADFVGEWWLPEDEDNVATGHLLSDPKKGLTLDVVSDVPLFRRGPEVPILLGMTVDGRKITLRDVFRTSSRFHSPGGDHTIASPSAAFIGLHAKSVDSLRFESIEARLSNLTEWCYLSGIDAPRQLQHGGDVTLRVPPPLTLARTAGTHVAVRYEFDSERIPNKNANPYDLTIRQHAWLTLRRGRGRLHYDRFDELLTQIRWFLGFAASAQDELLELRGTTTLSTRTFGPRGRTHRYSGRVAILLRQHKLLVPTQRPAREMLFCRADVNVDEIARPLTRWLSLNRRLHMAPVFGPYWAALATESFYSDHRFAMFAQCAEAYVGRRKPKLTTFEQKIRYLVDSSPRAVRRELPPAKEFAKEVVQARNHLTHRDAQSYQRAATGARLWALTELVKHVYDMAILRDLGFTQSAIAHLADSDRNMRVYGERHRAMEVLAETKPGR